MIIQPIKHTVKTLYSAFKRMMDEDGLMAAGHISFTAFLSLFPFLIFLAALVGFLSSADDVPKIIDLMFEFMPKEVAEAMAPAVTEVISIKPAGLLTIGFIGTLWASSSGVESLRIALNRAYRVKRKRPIWQRRLQSILFVGIAAFAIFFLSLMVLFGPIIWKVVQPILHYGFLQEIIFNLSRYSSAILVLTGAMLILHRWLPHAKLRSKRLLPGILFSMLLFIIGGSAFSFYLANFGDFNLTYGSLGSIVIALIFFYLSAIIFIYGAYLNAEIAKNKNEKIKQ